MAGKRLRRVMFWVRTKFSSLVSAIGTKIKLKFVLKYILKYILSIIFGFIILIISFIILSAIPELYKVCLDYIPWINDKEGQPDFSIPSILEIAALVAVAWQIRSAQKNLFIENDLQTGDSLNLCITEITFRLNDPKILVSENKINDAKCRKYMHKAVRLLDGEKPEEKELIDCLNRYKTDNLIDIHNWVVDIEKYGQKVIDKYKKQNTNGSK
jgi:hypothetical protein